MSEASLISAPPSRHLRPPSAPPPLSRFSPSPPFKLHLPRLRLTRLTTSVVPSSSSVLSVAGGSHDDTLHGDDDGSPSSIQLLPIAGEEQFHRVVAEAHEHHEPLIILWMASWCRKCIYLKPKLEKLAAEYHPSMRFCCVDVNSVPQRLVNRAGVSKMPTIQLWKDGEKQDEVVAGHQAWLAIDDIRRMIDNDDD